MPYNDNEMNYSRTEFAVCLSFGFLLILKLTFLFVHYIVCLTTTHIGGFTKKGRTGKRVKSVPRPNSINTLWRFPWKENDHQGHHFFIELTPSDKRWGPSFPEKKSTQGQNNGWGGLEQNRFSIQACVTHTSKFQYWETIHRYFWYFPYFLD